MPGAGDDLMELRRGRCCIVMNGVEPSGLEYRIVNQRGKLLRIVVIDCVL